MTPIAPATASLAADARDLELEARVASEVRAFRGVWKAFDAGFLLHVPSAHVLEAPDELIRHVQGRESVEGADAELDEIARGLPMPPPRDVKTDVVACSLNLAQGCNLRCLYCFAGEGDYGNKGLMKLDTAVAALELLTKDKAYFHVIFFGGEPFLNYPVMKDVVTWCEAREAATGTRFSYAVTTNGTLLNDEKLAWLKAKKVSVTLSYDGHGLQAKQRPMVGQQSSEPVVEKKLRAFQEQLASLRSFILRSTVMRDNVNLLEEAILKTLTTHNYRLAVYHQASPLKVFHFTEADAAKLAAVYVKVIDRLVEAGDFKALLRLDNVKKHLLNIRDGKTGGKACGAGVNYLTVSAEGAFHLCHRFNEDESERFGDVLHGLDQKKLDAVSAFREAKKAPCDTCWMREWCAGGCLHENKAATGDTFAVDPMFCRLQAVEIEQAMRVYAILLERAPELLSA